MNSLLVLEKRIFALNTIQPPRLNRRQLIIFILCLLSNLSFLISLFKYIKDRLWGEYLFVIPNIKLYIGSISFKTYILVNSHVIISSVLLIAMTFQILCQHYNCIRIIYHRWIGYFIVCFSALFFVIGEIISIIALKTPFNQFLYVALPWIFIIGIVLAVSAIRQKKIYTHISLVLQSFIILCSAAIYRCIFILLVIFRNFVPNNPIESINFTPDQLPIDGPAIILYITVIIACLSVCSSYKNKIIIYVIPLALLVMLIYGLYFIPWQFFGITDISSIINSPTFLLKHFLKALPLT